MKNWSKMRILNTVIWSLLVLGLVIALSFVGRQEKKLLCSNVEIKILPETDNFFTDYEDIAGMVTGDGNVQALIGKPINMFLVGSLEQNILTNPYIEDAEVFCDIDGALRVEVIQRQPVIRIFKSGSAGYYIDTKGKKMPLSSGYSARVLVATGNIYEKYSGKDSLESQVAKDLFTLASFINAHKFWSTQIDEIQVNQESEFTLIPKVGDHRIVLGSIDDMEGKFRKLWLFYKKAIGRVGWETYKVINLKYTGQIVCEKRINAELN